MTTQRPADVTPIHDWNRQLDGKVAVVTGGGVGIGRAVAELFAQHGAAVEIAEIDPDRAADAETSIGGGAGVAVGAVRAHVVDVRDDDAVGSFATQVLDKHGRVDVLVNNVGDFRPLVRFADSSPDTWKAMYDINLRHVFSVTHAFIGSMIEHGAGSIVNIHSVEGMRGYPGDPVYGAMKGAVAHFTTCLAVSMGRHGIRVNGIGTDLTHTPQVDYLTGGEEHEHLWSSWAPVGRVGWPEDQARVALFLAGDQSGFVTGHNVAVDGGTKAGGGWMFSPKAKRFVNRPTGL
jgi:NAD(P)-dependent dehydrogenase (short-subunit alcohol dehydrogenase family)